MDQDKVRAAAETMAGLGFGHDNQCVAGDKCCCCPKFFFLVVFDDIRCVQVFNGACTTWNPGKFCGSHSD